MDDIMEIVFVCRDCDARFPLQVTKEGHVFLCAVCGAQYELVADIEPGADPSELARSIKQLSAGSPVAERRDLLSKAEKARRQQEPVDWNAVPAEELINDSGRRNPSLMNIDSIENEQVRDVMKALHGRVEEIVFPHTAERKEQGYIRTEKIFRRFTSNFHGPGGWQAILTAAFPGTIVFLLLAIYFSVGEGSTPVLGLYLAAGDWRVWFSAILLSLFLAVPALSLLPALRSVPKVFKKLHLPHREKQETGTS